MSIKPRPLRVGHSPLTGTIYAGHLGKDGRTWLANKTDVTSDVVAAIIDKVEPGHTLTVTRQSDGQKFEIAVTSVASEPTA